VPWSSVRRRYITSESRRSVLGGLPWASSIQRVSSGSSHAGPGMADLVDRDDVNSGLELAVPSPAESVPGLVAAGSRDGSENYNSTQPSITKPGAYATPDQSRTEGFEVASAYVSRHHIVG
jgi:hypothetical protein